MTDTNGAFTLEDISPGDYTVEVWHETLGKVQQKVAVRPKAVVTVNLELANP